MSRRAKWAIRLEIPDSIYAFFYSIVTTWQHTFTQKVIHWHIYREGNRLQKTILEQFDGGKSAGTTW